MPSASGRALVAATFVVALTGTSQVGGAGSDRHPAGLRTSASFRTSAGLGPSRAVTERPGWHGGAFKAATGDTATIYVSDTYPEDQVVPQVWAEFFAALPHGSELASVLVRIAPPTEVEALCGVGALGCYGHEELVVIGEPAGGLTPQQVARHEYGHHVASHRSNPPWRAVDWGTKRWASAQRVCARAKRGTVFPGDEGHRYTLNPGEAFAETYRVLAEQQAGAVLSSWSVIDGSFYPDAAALRAAAEDVANPWTRPTAKTVRARFDVGGARRWLMPVATPLDGELTAELRLPSGRLDTFELISPEGRVLSRGLWASASSRRLSFVVCGERRLALRVTRGGGPGHFDVTLTRP